MAGTVIHGVNAVREALLTPDRINRVYFAQESRAPAAGALIAEVKHRRVPFDFVPQAKLNAMTRTKEHQGVAAEISPVAYASLDAILAQCGPKALLLACDGVQHPKNLGLLIRTATGAGCSGMILTQRGGALLDEDVVRASAGTVLRMPILPVHKLPETLRALKEEGFWVYALDPAAPATLYDTRWPDRVVLVLGNETDGLRPIVFKCCDAAVRIPLANELDSLNVAIAAGIALFHIARTQTVAP
jgi:23S rRNA (guanosine2251-2'-O)-methyltransferase